MQSHATSNINLNKRLRLPCGAELKNRLAKSAMSENMGSPQFRANEKFEKVYRRWAQGGAGLLITGNVMIDSKALGEPNNVVIEKGSEGLDELKKWALAGQSNQTHIWMQINHPGKQSPKFISPEPVAPSAVPFRAPLNKAFNCPRALTETEILDIISRFAYAAKVAKDSGFTGVQIHGAHGYLVSQFLSPFHNIRTDKWGGSLENRMRFVLEIYKNMRSEVGKDFPISIKLNSADFQKGGFTEEDSMKVVQSLSLAGIDLIEISGGTYESPKMTGRKDSQTKAAQPKSGETKSETIKPIEQSASTIKREAYFIEYCEKVRGLIQTPLMLTGGFRSRDGMESALASGACDLIGLARSLAIAPNFANDLLTGNPVQSQVHPLSTGIKFLDKLFPLEITWYTGQIQRMGKGRDPKPEASALGSVVSSLITIGWKSLRRVRS